MSRERIVSKAKGIIIVKAVEDLEIALEYILRAIVNLEGSPAPPNLILLHGGLGKDPDCPECKLKLVTGDGDDEVD